MIDLTGRPVRAAAGASGHDRAGGAGAGRHLCADPGQDRSDRRCSRSLVLAPTVAVPMAGNDVSLALLVAREVVIGLSIAFAVRALIAAAELAGHLSGFQIGFSYAATIDPVSGVRNSVITSLYGLLAMLAFFAINGHHEVLRALVASPTRACRSAAGHIDASILTARPPDPRARLHRRRAAGGARSSSSC